jgi:hypothetical protein
MEERRDSRDFATNIDFSNEMAFVAFENSIVPFIYLYKININLLIFYTV